MTYQTEQELEQLLIKQLQEQGYSRVKIDDEEQLKANFRKQLNLFNKTKLNGLELTDKEFNRILIYLEGKSIFTSSKLFRDKVNIEREDGTSVYIKFFDSKDWHNNIFQVANQVTMQSKYVNRYDVTILINGLPMVQIELKRRGKDFKEAFNQIERYRRHSFKSLYRYLQVFVISNGVDTKYYANSDKDIKFDFTFFWSDEKNNRISNLNKFAESFLDRFNLNNIISKYMIIQDTEKNLMVMRPYQIYAVEALMKRAKETNNNGYIWHTTGSGKTLTSFKASQLLSNEDGIKKVFFLIDRKDLDSQTVEEFNKFEKDCVDTTDNVGTLIKQIEDINTRLIVTTIQKLARLLKAEKYQNRMEKYRDEKVVFIIDECHRSQFGEMHTAINKHFKYAQYFGFTGTPRLVENKSQDGRTTADIFDKCLHHYLIKDAINDGNVLGFSVEYIKTFDGDINEYDDEKIKGIDKDEAPYGPINKYNHIEDGVVSPLYFCFRLKDNICNDYLNKYFKSTKWHRYVYMNSDQGARHDRVSIKDSEIMKMRINFPSLQEQEKIANFLTKVDSLIEEQDGKVQDLELYKKGMMQKIFSQEIRFKDDNGCEYSEWLKKKVLDVGKVITGSTPSKEIKDYYTEKSDEISYAWITPTDISTNRDIRCGNTSLTLKGYDVVRKLPKNSVLVTCIASIGKNAILRNEGSCNQQINAIIPNEQNYSEFLYYTMEFNSNKLKKFAGMTATPILNKSDFSNLVFKFPCLQEQTKIANFLSNIDSIIEEEKNKLEDLRQWKKGLLQKMFV